MSFLSPVAAAILNTLQANNKSDSNANGGAFLSLLDTGSSDFSASSQSEQTLVDTLYTKNDEPTKVATQIPTAVFTENKQPALQPAASQPRNAEVENKKSALAETTVAKQTDSSPKKQDKQEADDNTGAKEALRPAQSQTENKTVAVPEKSAKAPAKGEAVSEQDALSQKLRSKISELSDILSSLAAMLGVGTVVQVQVTQVTKTTLTLTQQDLGVNQPFIDLSDRFAKLIAAVTASQNAITDAGSPLGNTFASFQQLVASFSTDAVVGQDSGALLENCAQCETDLSAALQNVSLVKGDKIDIGQLSDGLQKLSKWLGEVQSLVAPKTSGEVVVNDDVAPVVQKAAIVAAPQVAAINIAAPVVQKETTGKEADAGENATVSSAAVVTSNTAPVAQPVIAQPQNTNQNTNTVAAAVNAVENNASSGGNLSGNNGNGAQGGERQAGAITSFSGLGAANTGSTVGASSFSKMLKETAQPAPVADQVAVNIKTAIKDGTSKIQIQLDPLELGKLHIKIDLSSDGKATGVVITADNKETLALLQRDSRGLEAALADAGIKTDSGSLSFNLRGGNQGQGREEAPKAPYGGYANLTEEEDTLTPLSVVSRSYVVNTTDGLDIQI